MKVTLVPRATLGWETEQDLIDAGGVKITMTEQWRRCTTAAEVALGQSRELLAFRLTNASKGYVLLSAKTDLNAGVAMQNWTLGVSTNATNVTPPVFAVVTPDVDRTELPNFNFNNILSAFGTVEKQINIVQGVAGEILEISLLDVIDQTTGMNFIGGTGDIIQFWHTTIENFSWHQDITICLYEFDI